MRKQITLRDKPIWFTVRQNKLAKKLEVKVVSGGRVIVWTPGEPNLESAERLLTKKAAWLLRELKKYGRA